MSYMYGVVTRHDGVYADPNQTRQCPTLSRGQCSTVSNVLLCCGGANVDICFTRACSPLSMTNTQNIQLGLTVDVRNELRQSNRVTSSQLIQANSGNLHMPGSRQSPQIILSQSCIAALQPSFCFGQRCVLQSAHHTI